MAAVIQHLHLLGRNWRLGLWTAIAPLLVFTALVFFSIGSREWSTGLIWVLLFLPLFAGSVGTHVGETHKEVLYKEWGLILPRALRAMEMSQVVIMGSLGLLVFCLGYFLPTDVGLTRGQWVPSLNLTITSWYIYGLAYTLTMAAESSAKKHFLPTIYFYWLAIRWGNQIYESQSVSPDHWPLSLLNLHWGYCIVALLVLAFFILLFRVIDFPRNMAGQPYLSPLHILRPERVQAFRRQAEAHLGNEDSSRPGARWIAAALQRASLARRKGECASALSWEAIHLYLSANLTRSRWILGLLGLGMVTFMIFVGYYDARNYLCGRDSLIGWFTAFPFGFVLIPTLVLYTLIDRPFPWPVGRKELEQSGRQLFVLCIAMLIVGSAGVMGLYHLLAWALPTINNVPLMPPISTHTPFLPLLVFPVAGVLTLLWKGSNLPLVYSQACLQTLIILHAILNEGGYGWPLVLVLVLSLGSLSALPWMWRRRIRLMQ